MSRRSFERRKRKYAKMRPDDLKKLLKESYREQSEYWDYVREKGGLDKLPAREQRRGEEITIEQLAMNSVIYDRIVIEYADVPTDDLQKLYDKYQRETEQARSDPEAFNALPEHEQKSLLEGQNKRVYLASLIERRKGEERQREAQQRWREKQERENKEKPSWGEILLIGIVVFGLLYALATGTPISRLD